MHRRWSLVCVVTITLWETIFITALPVTLLEDAKAAEARLDNKVKRSHVGGSLTLNAESNSGTPLAYYGNPSASKRASSSLKTSDTSDEVAGEWDPSQDNNERPSSKTELAKELFGTDDNPFEDKTITEYEKGFHYGTNKAKLDEQMENAILKSEMYGDPASINQYRYYGGTDDRRRKRSNIRFTNRYKREDELSAEDILTLLSLWDEERLRQPVGYRTNWPRYNSDLDLDNDRDENEIDDPDETWLESPVYPGVRDPVHIGQYAHHAAAPYSNEPREQIFASKRPWGGFADKKRKRFMVSRKRSDPTRELRYLNGPAQNHDDMYALSQLLGPPSQREMGLPMYHRMGL